MRKGISIEPLIHGASNKLLFAAMTLIAPFMTILLGVIILHKSSISLANKKSGFATLKTF